MFCLKIALMKLDKKTKLTRAVQSQGNDLHNYTKFLIIRIRHFHFDYHYPFQVTYLTYTIVQMENKQHIRPLFLLRPNLSRVLGFYLTHKYYNKIGESIVLLFLWFFPNVGRVSMKKCI